MIHIRSIPEYRLVIPGRARSFRSTKATIYKRIVRKIARRIFSKPVSDQRIEVLIDYFHASQRRLDMDNIAKCILDALNGVAYVDDQQVRVQSATAHALQSLVHIVAAPVDLIKPLRKYEEYVFIRVRYGEAD